MAAEGAFDPLDFVRRQREIGGAGSSASRNPIVLQSAADFVGDFKAPDFIVDDIIQRGYLYALTGQTGHGKTAVGLHLACCQATGRPFAGHAVERTRVAYLAGENADDVRARLIVQAEQFGIPLSDIDLWLYGAPFDIVAAQGDLEAASAERPFGAVHIDTCAAFFQGDDENSNTELGGFARDLRRVVCGLPGQPAAIVYAHPTKGATKHTLLPRGGGAFVAEVDGNLRVWKDDDAATEFHWYWKLRAPSFEPIHFKLERATSDQLRDAKGRHIPSVVASPMSETELKQAQQAARSDEDAVLEMLLQFPSGSFADWCERLGWMSRSAIPAPQKSKVHRAMERLAADRFVKQERGRWKLTKAGRDEAGKAIGAYR